LHFLRGARVKDRQKKREKEDKEGQWIRKRRKLNEWRKRTGEKDKQWMLERYKMKEGWEKERKKGTNKRPTNKHWGLIWRTEEVGK